MTRAVLLLLFLPISTACAHVGPPAVGHESPPASRSRRVTGPNFLVISDIHLNDERSVSEYGETHDTGTDLWRSFQAEIAKLLARPHPPSFVLYLGDLPAHTDATPRPNIRRDIGEVLRGLRTLAENAPRPVPLLYLPGNNDSLWGDYCELSDADRNPEPPYTEDSGHALAWPLINGVSCAAQKGRSNACLLDATHRLDGYYSAYPTKDHRLRALMLNTVMLSGNPCADSRHPWNNRRAEGDRQLDWLADQLESAQANGEKVLIAMHIPPGEDRYCTSSGTYRGRMWEHADQQETFLREVSDYQNVIVGVLTGHTHLDEIRVLHGPDGPVALAFSAPGISPNHGQNPGFKLVEYDAATWQLTDFTTYYTELPLTASSNWNRHYSFRDAYSCRTSDETIWDCAKRQSTAELYEGLLETLFVKKTTPSCDVSALLNVGYTDR